LEVLESSADAPDSPPSAILPPAPAGSTIETPTAVKTAGLTPTAPTLAPVKTPYILVVDDDDSIKKIIKKALKQLPLEVEVDTAGNGLEAMAKVEERPPDLVMLDVMMPGMDGFSVCQRLREGLRTAFVPIMMLTADANESNRTKGFLMGTDDYVSKPFSVPDLNARVLRLLRRTYGL
jgi:DNA-binding response OmpR family regulator